MRETQDTSKKIRAQYHREAAMDTTQVSASHADFLTSPAKKITVNRINFTAANLPEYEGLYAIVIDGALTTDECNALVRGAEASSVKG